MSFDFDISMRFYDSACEIFVTSFNDTSLMHPLTRAMHDSKHAGGHFEHTL